MYMLLLLFQKKDKDAKSSASFIIPPDQADKYKPLQNRVSTAASRHVTAARVTHARSSQ